MEELEPDADRPDLLQLKRGLLPNQLALVPRFRVGANNSFARDELLCSKEPDLALADAVVDRNLPFSPRSSLAAAEGPESTQSGHSTSVAEGHKATSLRQSGEQTAADYRKLLRLGRPCSASSKKYNVSPLSRD